MSGGSSAAPADGAASHSTPAAAAASHSAPAAAAASHSAPADDAASLSTPAAAAASQSTPADEITSTSNSNSNSTSTSRTGIAATDAPLDDARRPRATIVIPTWNGAAHLPTCLDALRAQRGCTDPSAPGGVGDVGIFPDPSAPIGAGDVEIFPDPSAPVGARSIEILVVDNGSTDDTAAVLARYPEVRAIALPHNLGFARAVNAGIRAARADVVVLLNNDTEAEPTWLAALLAALDADPAIGAATSKVRLFDRRDRLHTTGDVVDATGMAGNRGVWEVDVGQYDAAREVFGASGAAAAYRRALFDDVGLFEAAFESYYEDVDLAVRARLAGWRTVFAPDAVVYHKLSATGGGAYASYRVARNRVWLLARCWPGGILRRHALAIVAQQARLAVDALRHWRGAAARATLRGLVVGWLTWPRWLKARRRILGRRRIDDARFGDWLGTPDR